MAEQQTMNRKRTLMYEVYKSKRQCIHPDSPDEESEDTTSDDSCDYYDDELKTWSALMFLRELFPLDKFQQRLPPILLKHQLYSVVKNRHMVDIELNEMRENKEVKIFKTGPDPYSLSVVFTDDYQRHVIHTLTELNMDKTVIDKVIKYLVDQSIDICFHKHTLIKEFCFSDAEIAQLAKAGILTVRDEGSFWLAIPGFRIFLKTFTRGRKALITMIKTSKYKQIFRQDLEQSRWLKAARLGILYHIHDAIGAGLVERIDIGSGQLLVLPE